MAAALALLATFATSALHRLEVIGSGARWGLTLGSLAFAGLYAGIIGMYILEPVHRTGDHPVLSNTLRWFPAAYLPLIPLALIVPAGADAFDSGRQALIALGLDSISSMRSTVHFRVENGGFEVARGGTLFKARPNEKGRPGNAGRPFSNSRTLELSITPEAAGRSLR